MATARAETGLLLPGGGARAAYQVGALRAIARLLTKHAEQPFPVICGTSAGAINAVVLGAHADSFRRGVARLLRWWRGIDVTDVYRADFATLGRHGLQLLASLGGGGLGPERAASLLDNAPLRQLLAAEIDTARIGGHIEAGRLHAVAINATSYGSGQAVTFYDAAPALAPWHRVRRRSERCRLEIDHLMASAAIPLVSSDRRVGRRLLHGRIGPADRTTRARAPSRCHEGAGHRRRAITGQTGARPWRATRRRADRRARVVVGLSR
jgi:NTE family protein